MNALFVLPSSNLDQAIAIIGSTCSNLLGIKIGQTIIPVSQTEAAIATIVVNSTDLQTQELTNKLLQADLQISQLPLEWLSNMLLSDPELEESTWSEPDQDLGRIVRPFSSNVFESHRDFEAAICSQITRNTKVKFGGQEEILIAIYRAGWVIPEKSVPSYGPQPISVHSKAGQVFMPHSKQAYDCQSFIGILKSRVSVRDGEYR